MNLVLCISTLLYAALLIVALLGMRRLKAVRAQNYSKTTDIAISVVVPFRNEAENLSALVHDLQHQTYQNFEVIFVDDHSEDASPDIIAALIEHLPDFNLLALNTASGKKSALTTGINRAAGEIIVTADADVRLPESWLTNLAEAFVEQNADMLILPLRVAPKASDGDHFFQQSENCAIQGLGFGLAAWSWPISCNGANLAFRKSSFDTCGGYSAHQQSASGDDVLLMQEMLRNHFRVFPLLSTEVLATTLPQPDWKSALSQRVRWAGKTGKINNAPAIVTGLILLLNALALTTALFVSTTDWTLWLGAVTIKVLLDVLLIKSIEQSFNQRLNPLKLALIAVGYIFYLPIVTILSVTWKPTWKGRRI